MVTSGEHKSQRSKCDQLLAAVVFVSRFGMVGPYNYRNRPMFNPLYYYCDLKSRHWLDHLSAYANDLADNLVLSRVIPFR